MWRHTFGADSADVLFKEIEEGNLNDVFRVYSKSNLEVSVIVKCAPPYIKCLGPDYPLGTERGEIEYKALQYFNALSPGSVPEPFLYDKETHLVFMEDLKNHVVYRKQLISGQLDDEAAKKIARDIGIIHRETHVGKTGQESLQRLESEFDNWNLVSLTKKYIFTGPFTQDEPTNHCSAEVRLKLLCIYEDQDVLQAAAKMKKMFLEKKECLLHGDLHTGSLMVKGSDIKMIDAEFAFVGPCAFDVGLLLANYIFAYYRHILHQVDNHSHRQFAYRIVDICHHTVDEYLSHMTSYTGQNRESYVENLMSEVAGFTGCELIRRIVGAAHVEDLETAPSQHAAVEALEAGIRLLTACHRIQDIGRMMVIALMLA